MDCYSYHHTHYRLQLLRKETPLDFNQHLPTTKFCADISKACIYLILDPLHLYIQIFIFSPEFSEILGLGGPFLNPCGVKRTP